MSETTRAERRRRLRQAGYKRAASKKGRRPALRAPVTETVPVVSALVLPTPELTERILAGQVRVPNVDEIAEVAARGLH
jgi:hypothetical protein